MSSKALLTREECRRLSSENLQDYTCDTLGDSRQICNHASSNERAQAEHCGKFTTANGPRVHTAKDSQGVYCDGSPKDCYRTRIPLGKAAGSTS